MTSPRAYRVLGGLCANGHRLTAETAYIIPYQSTRHHRNRPPGPRVRCATCHTATINKRLNSQPMKRVDPDASHTCGCGMTMVRRAFGVRGHNQDGTAQYHGICGPCRVRANNARVQAARRERVKQEHEERVDLTRWVIDQAWRLKRERGIALRETRDVLGVPIETWSHWRCGRHLPRLERLGPIVERLRVVLVENNLL